MKKIYYIIIVLIAIIVVSVTIFINMRAFNYKEGNGENEIENSENIIYNIEEIETIKNELNATANTDIYQIEEEIDGRKIIQIKPQVQFEVDLAGVIKNDKPEEKELKSLLKKVPKAGGVWISKQSREAFLELLEKNNIENTKINDEGYLQIYNSAKDDIEKELDNMIKSDKLYIINMTGIAYQRDYITGEIMEYPFEDMDPFQIIEQYEDGNTIILEVTTNKKSKLTEKEILETIIKY